MNGQRRPRTVIVFYRPEWVIDDLVTTLAADSAVEVLTLYRRSRGLDGSSPAYVTKRQLAVREALFFLRGLLSARMYRSDRFVCRSGHYSTMLFALLLRKLGRRRHVYLLNFFLHEMGQRASIQHLLKTLLTDDVFVFAAAQSDMEYLARFLPTENIIRSPYCQAEPEWMPLSEASDGGYLFSGGSTNRDPDTVLRVAASLPDVPFVVVTPSQTVLREPVPGNVTLEHDVSQGRFERLVGGSRAVIIALKSDTGSSGQMVLLTAMALRKPIIAPRIGAIADYITEGKTGVFYTYGSDQELRQTARALMEDPERADRIGRAAREEYLARFTPERQYKQIATRLRADWKQPTTRETG